jgi:methyl-accepting chemotaxis protein
LTEPKTLPFLSRSLFLTTALVALIVAATFWLGWQNKTDDRLVSHTLEIRTNLVSLLSLVQSVETGQRGYLLTGQEMYLGPYQTALQQLPALLDRVQNLTNDNPRQLESVAELRKLIHDKLDELRSTIDAYRSEKKNLALAIVNSDNGFQLMAEIRRVIEAMEAEEGRLLTERQTSAER